MSRFSAFAVHLGISFVIFLVLAYLIVFQWYPGMFFDTDGGWRGMRIIFAVDLVLGPLLTLIVFKAGKPGLKFDLTLIGLIQLFCLSAGTYIVYDERPLAVVYTDGRFTVMSADEYEQDAGINVPDLSLFPGSYPKWVAVKMPDDAEEEQSIRSNAINSGRSISSFTDLYVPFSSELDGFTEESTDPSVFESQDRWVSALTDWGNLHEGSINDYRFYVFSTRYEFMYLAYDKATNTKTGLLKLVSRTEESASAS